MSRIAHLSLAVLPLVLGLACLAFLDASERTAPPAVVVRERTASTRLLVLMVDSLDVRDVETPGALPRLRAHLGRAGLHGPVRACVDGVTIPCVSAMVTGFDHASGFSPLRNFGAARGLTDRSVLGALLRRGHRVGYFGDPLLAKALEGLTMIEAPEHEDVVDDAHTLNAGLAALAARRVEVAFVHLLALDETAHKFTASGAAYRQALTLLDDRLDRALRSLRHDDHAVILGDHGHEESGRHSADIGTMTYAAYFGPRFARPVARSMAMTDHAGVWSRLFGLGWGSRSAGDDYFEGRAVPAGEPVLRARPRDLAPLAACFGLALLLGLTGRLVHESRVTLTIAAAVASGVMIALSVLVSYAFSSLASELVACLLAALLGCAGALVLLIATRRVPPHAADSGLRDWRALTLAGALLLALPTAEPTAGLKAPVLWLLVCLAPATLQALRAKRWRATLTVLSCWLLLAVLAAVRVRDYLPRSLLEQDRGPLWSTLVPAALLIAASGTVGGLRSAAASLLGAVAAPWLAQHAGRWLIIPCAAVLPLTFLAFRRRGGFDVVCLLVPIACHSFFPQDSAQLASVAACWWLWAVLPTFLRTQTLLLRTATFVLLTWLSFWAAMSTRIGGVDYDFYFRWLPTQAGATAEAVQQGLLTATKCLLPAAFGALLATRAGALPLEVLKSAEQLMRVRLALTIVFVVGLSTLRGTPNLQLLYDGTQEVAFWLLMFAVLGLVAAANQVGKTELTAR